MTRTDIRALKAMATTRLINAALEAMDDLWAQRCRPVDPDDVAELDELEAARVLFIRDRADEILNADRNAKEGMRAA